MAINLLALEPHKVSRDLSGYITYIYGPPKSGKAQPLTDIIPTPEGYKEIGSLKVGDKVFNRHGKAETITGVFPQGKLPVYKVTLEDGRDMLCNDEHIFSCYTSRGNLKDFTVREMLDLGVKDNDNRNRFSIPMNEAVIYEEKDFSVDPYVLGAFLGDGCCKERQLTISSNDEELVQEIANILHTTYNRQSINNYSWHFDDNAEHQRPQIKKIQTLNIFKDYINEVCVGAETKSIPEEYLLGSIEQRFSLLQGLLDTDGSISSTDYAIRFTTISEKLAEGVIELANSLGFKASTIIDKRAEKYTTNICYNVRINCSNKDKIKLFRLSRKLEIAQKAYDVEQTRHYNRIKIVSIEDMNYMTDMACIMVDDKEHLYLSNNYIVTHNTTLGSQMPKPLLLAFERGYNAIPGIIAQDITSWSEVRQVLRELKKPEVKEIFSTIIVDTVNKFAVLN